MKKFKETGSVNDKPWAVKPRISEVTVTVAQEDFERSPQKSVRHVPAELNIPQATVHKILKVKFFQKSGNIEETPQN